MLIWLILIGLFVLFLFYPIFSVILENKVSPSSKYYKKTEHISKLVSVIIFIIGAILCLSFSSVSNIGSNDDVVDDYQYDDGDDDQYDNYQYDDDQYGNDDDNPSYDKDISSDGNKSDYTDGLAEEYERKGFIVSKDGYTYDRCTDTAATYLRTKYGYRFDDSETLVVMKPSNLSTYYVVGLTTGGKLFTVSILHMDDGTWGVITAKVES